MCIFYIYYNLTYINIFFLILVNAHAMTVINRSRPEREGLERKETQTVSDEPGHEPVGGHVSQ